MVFLLFVVVVNKSGAASFSFSVESYAAYFITRNKIFARKYLAFQWKRDSWQKEMG